MKKGDRGLTFFVGLFSAMYWTSFTLILVYTFLSLTNALAVLLDINLLIHLISFLKISWFGLFSLTRFGFVILVIYSLPAFLLQLTLMSIITKHEEVDEDDPFAEFMQVFGTIFGIIGTIVGGLLLSRMF